MTTLDSTTFQALGTLLTVLGLVVSLLVWRRRGAASGLRGVAWSLLPAAAAFTGTLRLLWQIGELVARWAVRLVLSPFVWLGIALFGVSVVLFLVTALMRARGVGRRTAGRAAEPELRSGERSPERGRSGGRALSDQRRGQARPAVQDEDMDDIEAILRKHGIS